MSARLHKRTQRQQVPAILASVKHNWAKAIKKRQAKEQQRVQVTLAKLQQ